MKAQHLCGLALILLVAILGAACGGSEPAEPETGSTPAQADAPATTPTAMDTSGSTAAEGIIAFMSERDGNWNIYVMNADGSDQRRLTDNPADDRSPSWSPDGKGIAFDSLRDDSDMQDTNPNYNIYVMNADGSDQIRLTDHPRYDSSPSWSPDGLSIAFQTGRDARYENIYVVNADGSDERRLTDDPVNEGSPAWSPDGEQIAFVSLRDGNWDIYVMNADGSDERRLTDDPASEGSPAWSPDGTRIAFYSDRDGNVNVYVMNADGSGQRRLTDDPSSDQSPSWSPDGEHIAFVSDRDGDLNIYVMNADGSGETRLTDDPADDYGPSWSPLSGQ